MLLNIETEHYNIRQRQSHYSLIWNMINATDAGTDPGSGSGDANGSLIAVGNMWPPKAEVPTRRVLSHVPRESSLKMDMQFETEQERQKA